MKDSIHGTLGENGPEQVNTQNTYILKEQGYEAKLVQAYRERPERIRIAKST